MTLNMRERDDLKEIRRRCFFFGLQIYHLIIEMIHFDIAVLIDFELIYQIDL